MPKFTRNQWDQILRQIDILENLNQQKGVEMLANQMQPRKSTKKRLQILEADAHNARTILQNMIRDFDGEEN